MKKLVKIYLFAAGLFFLSVSNVFADGFVINLHYDSATKTLTFDKAAGKEVLRDQNADTSIVAFSNDMTIGPFILKLYDAQGIEISSSQFNKKDGAFQLIIPYFSLAAQLKIIEKSTDKELLVANLKEFLTCNGNGKCEPELGETTQSCLGDCKALPLAAVQDIAKNPAMLSEGAQTIVAEEVKPLSLWQKIVLFFTNLWDSIMHIF